MQVALTMRSTNKKVGPLPVSTTEAPSCPDACPLKEGGCYANTGPLWLFWGKVNRGEAGMSWDKFAAKIKTLPFNQLWRHNQAGDLPGENNHIDRKKLRKLVRANKGKRGWTYSHKPMAIAANRETVAEANREGFTINLSANNLKHADALADLGIAPVTVVLNLPEGQRYDLTTPKGRRVVTCPATYIKDFNCQKCKGLCQRQRDAIIGFPVHGGQKKKAAAVAAG